jgi:hypothetical protein
MWNIGFSSFSSTYSLCGFQHLEPIEYVNGVARFLPSFELNDPKVMNEFPSLSKSMVQNPPTQVLDSNLHFYKNENFDFIL